MTFLREFRLTWAPLCRTILSSAADLVADYFYYDSIVNKQSDVALDKFSPYLFIFLIVSFTMGGVTVLSVIIKGCFPGKGTSIQRPLEIILYLESILGDIPQFVLTAMITVEMGLLTPNAMFNFVTSALNFSLNLLETCTPEMDKEPSDEPPATAPVNSGGPEEDTTGAATIAVTGVAAEEEA